MSRRQRIAAALAGCVLASTALVSGAGTAGAAQLEDSGWWWRANPGQGSVTPPGLPSTGLPSGAPETPAPPDVPEDGLVVERGPDGATAIAAVRFLLDSGSSSPTLELQAADAQGAPELRACQAGSVWSGAHGGRWDSRPRIACGTDGDGASVSGTPDDEGVWTFDLATLVVEGGGSDRIDVVIVPEAPDGEVAPPFRVVFEPVTGGSLTTGFGGDEGGGFDPDAAFGAGFGEASGDFGTGMGASDLDFGADPAVGGLDPPDTPTDVAGQAPTGDERPQLTLTPSPAAVADDSTATTAAVGVILLAGAVLFAASRQQSPSLAGLIPLRAVNRSVAPDAEPRVAGLGRFARPRTSAPTPLS